MKRRGVVRIEESGAIRAADPTAEQEVRAHKGEFVVLPSPRELLVLKRVTAAEDSRACRLSGEISTPGALCDIVAFIGYARWRGELVALDGKWSRSVYFDGDSVVSARSSAEHERLGHVLYRRGALTRQQVMEAAAATKSGATRFGEAIVKLGFLSGEDLFRWMESQVREVFESAIRIEAGAFYFFDGFDEARLAFRMRGAVSAMLTDAVRRMDEMKYFRERIPSADYVPARVPDRVPDSNTNRLYPVVDGQRSIADICRLVRADELEVTRALFELAQAGYIMIQPPRVGSIRGMVGVFNQAISLIMHELDAAGSGEPIRKQLATFAAGGGVYPLLFAGAGPTKDGTFDAAHVERNFKNFQTHQDPLTLSAWLHDYVSYALFLARPYIDRAQAEPGARVARAVDARRLSDRLRIVLSPIAPRDAGRPK
jgi:hypothetical protein